MIASIKQKKTIPVFLVALVLACFAISRSVQAAQPPNVQNVNEFNTPFQREFFIEIPPGLNFGAADVAIPLDKTLVVEFVSVSGNFPAGEHPIELLFFANNPFAGRATAHLLWNFQASANDRDVFVASQQIRLYGKDELDVFLGRDVSAGRGVMNVHVSGYLVNTP